MADAEHFGARHAVLLVHEFATPLTRPERHAANTRVLGDFVRRLGAEVPAEPAEGDYGWVVGPLSVPGNARLPAELPVYVAKRHQQVV